MSDDLLKLPPPLVLDERSYGASSSRIAGPSEPEPAALEFIDPIRDWAGRAAPPRQWMVDGWVPWHAVTLFSGNGGEGKSLLAMQMQTCAAIGRDWLGLPTRRVRSLGLYCEDEDEELWRRQEGINRHYGIEMGDLEDLTYLARPSEENILMTFDGGRALLTSFWHQLRNLADERGSQLIIIDTSADTFGGNEIIRPEVHRFVRNGLGHLARQIDGAVVLLSHPSRIGITTGDGDSGSTAWNATVRSRFYLRRPPSEGGAPPDDARRTLTRKKSNYGPRNAELTLRWHEGGFAIDTGFAPAGPLTSSEHRVAEAAFMTCLQELDRQGRNVSASKNASNYAPSFMVKHRLHAANGFRPHHLEAAMSTLFEANRIKVMPYGKAGRNRRLVIVSDTD